VSGDLRPLLEAQRASYARAGRGVSSSWPEERALDEDGVRGLFTATGLGVLATARPDGRAHAAPVSYRYENGAFWISTVAGLRLRNLEATPWASLVVMAGDGDGHRALTAEGPVEIHDAEGSSAPTWAAAIVELQPERVFSFGAAG
jgi:nitroimidazol reductase NimA-like FMN-containing flavoprotein (pyridoxamine 5'-phosphate oxidase superfamily)